MMTREMIYKILKQEYLETYMPKPDADFMEERKILKK